MTSPDPTAAVRARLYGQISVHLAEAARAGAPADEQPALVEQLIDRALREEGTAALMAGRAPLGVDEEQSLRRSLRHAFLGLGDLQPLLEHPDIENIDINGSDAVWVTYAGGKRERMAPVAPSDVELAATLRQLAASLGVQERRFDPGAPSLNLRLPDGSRLFAVQSVTERVCVSIRRHRLMQVSLHDLARLGLYPRAMVDLLEAMVAARFNVLVSGGMGSGKTTLLRAMCTQIDPDERIITIEDPYELGLDVDPAHPDVVAMQPRSANVEGAGSIDMVELVRYATRMNPTRVIVGEVRGAEASSLLLAINQGVDGSMSTIHASGTKEACEKLATYAVEASTHQSYPVAYRRIGAGIDAVIQLARATDGTRVVTSLREVVGADDTQPFTNEILTPGPDRRARPGSRLSDMRVDRLLDAGYDPSQLQVRWSS